ncbi:hypothetical protein [Tunturiibacter gelidoferens]|uniref:Uncharacterized protein n=1 Tax=Tunturiibacter lichenicola TaxID=2051959 RepID=A0A7Y9NMK0_9BACT|nr:hypothetical protein [Edaphobacter lichenicola]NYF52126.1 hypothetical protein [Edaphobacter lichenicola]
MNRRAFLTSASSSVALAATVGLSPRRATAQSSNSTSAGVACLTAGNTIVSPTTSAGNWNAYRNTLISAANDWQANNLDGQLASYYANLQSYDCKSSYLNQNQILANMQASYPQVTLAQLQAGWAIVDGMATSDVNNFLTSIRQGGIVQYFTAAMQQAARYAEAASGTTITLKVPSPDWLLPPPVGGGGGGKKGACRESTTFAIDTM